MTSRPRFNSRDAGFTLVEILMVLGLVAILSVAGITVMTGSVDEDRYDATVAELRQIRAALVGDPELTQGGTRSSFGFLGDMGGLPTAAQGLAALQTKPAALPNFGINNTARFGLGWNGPYLATGASGGTFSFNDKWGRPYVYAPGTTATISSLGADGAAGGTGLNQDIVMTIPPERQLATVYGFLSNGGAAYNVAFQAELNHPNGAGALAQNLVTVPAGSQGAFVFANVPLGPRSATIYVPSKAAPTQTIGPIAFVVDKARFMIPTNLVDVNPSGGGGTGGATGGTGGTGACTSNGGRIAFDSSTTPFSLGPVASFRVNTTSAVNVTTVRVDPGVSTQVMAITIDNHTYGCSGSRTFSPCPGPAATTLTLSGNENINGNEPITILFNSNITSVSSMTMDLNYTNGCDRFTVSGML